MTSICGLVLAFLVGYFAACATCGLLRAHRRPRPTHKENP